MARYDNTAQQFTCKACRVKRDRSRFTFYVKEGYSCRSGKCKDCINADARRRPKPKRRKSVITVNRSYFSKAQGCEVKRCSFCGKVKPIDLFFLTVSHGSPMRVSFCDPCRLAYKRAYRRGQILSKAVTDVKRCSRCAQQKSIERFRRGRQVCVGCESYAHPERWTALTVEERTAILSARHLSALRYDGPRRARNAGAGRIEDVDRTAIIARDNGTCYLCGKKPQGSNLTLDHVVPLSRGGEHTEENLRVACMPCNTAKGNRLLTEIPTKKKPLTVEGLL